MQITALVFNIYLPSFVFFLILFHKR